jgi:hypothetical protein
MSNETQQTAVDKIVSLLNKKGFSPVLTDEEIKLFKEMEKEQIMSAFNIGEVMATDYFYGEDNCAENYYNETYGGNNV